MHKYMPRYTMFPWKHDPSLSYRPRFTWDQKNHLFPGVFDFTRLTLI